MKSLERGSRRRTHVQCTLDCVKQAGWEGLEAESMKKDGEDVQCRFHCWGEVGLEVGGAEATRIGVRVGAEEPGGSFSKLENEDKSIFCKRASSL